MGPVNGWSSAVIHFFVNDSTDLVGLEDWDPDADPTRFASGVGHNLLELHRRLLERGRLTSVGPVVPPGTTLVVVMPWPILHTGRRVQLRSAWRLRRHRVVMVRSDLPTTCEQPVRADVVVAPNRSFIDTFGAQYMRFLPPLPQRGLMVRDASRGDRISVATLKANPENIPTRLVDGEIIDRLGALGVTLDIDSPENSSGSDQSWQDFRSVDVAVCVRRRDSETISKPATKLLNAWAAGVIPIASREPAYVEIGSDRHDVLFFDELDEVPELIRLVQDDEVLREQLWRGVAESAAAQPTLDQLVDDWWSLFLENQAPPSRWRGFRSLSFFVGRVAGRSTLGRAGRATKAPDGRQSPVRSV
jgi:hypothetical protein